MHITINRQITPDCVTEKEIQNAVCSYATFELEAKNRGKKQQIESVGAVILCEVGDDLVTPLQTTGTDRQNTFQPPAGRQASRQ